jgi:hypothetical protein
VALTEDELALVRDEIGIADPPSDSDLDDIHERRGGLVGVVRAVWAGRLADLLALPATFSVSGEYSQSTSANIEAIRKRLSELSGLPDDSDDIPPVDDDGRRPVESLRLVRCDDTGR